MAPLAEAFIRLRLDSAGARREAERDLRDAGRAGGTSFRDGFNQGGGLLGGAGGTLGRNLGDFGGLGRNAAREFRDGFNGGGPVDGRGLSQGLGAGFGEAGRNAGRDFGDGFSRDASGRLRDARGRFASDLRNGPPLTLPVDVAPVRIPPIPNPPPVRVDVDVDVDRAKTALQGLWMNLTQLAQIPVGATLGVGLAALGGAAVAAGAGIGALAAVAVPSINRVKEALAAQDQAQQAEGAGAAAAQARSAAMAGARQALASAIRNQSYAHQQALQGVENAERQLATAQENAVDAAQRIAEARREAARSLADLRDRLVDTKLSLQQDSLAVQDAKDRLDELNRSQEAQLALRQADIGLREAQARLQEILNDPESTQLEKDAAQLAVDTAKEQQRQAQERIKQQERERQQAELAYKQAQQRYKEQQRALKELTQDEKDASKAGIDGSKEVLAAREALRDANRAVADSERALAAARANVARTDQQSADSVASARRGLAQAMAAGATSADAYQQALAKLSPAERDLLKDVEGLSGAWQKWQTAMQPKVLPLVSQGIDVLRGQIPSLTPLVEGATGAMGGLLDRIAEGAKSAEFGQFKQQIADLVPTAISGLGDVGLDIATGLGRIFQAFLPYAPRVIEFLQQGSQAFADWTKGISSGENSGFQALIQYVKDNGPLVLQTAQAMAAALLNVGTSLAPLAAGGGVGALATLRLLAVVVAGMSPGTIQALAIAFVAVRVALAGYKVAQTAAEGIRFVNAAFAAGSAGPLWARALTGAWNGLKNVASSAKTAAVSLWNQARAATASAAATVRAKVAAAGSWLADQARAAAALAVSLWNQVRAATAAALASARQAIATAVSTTASIAASAASRAWAGAQWLLNAALTANPIGLVVAAVVALVAAIVIAYKNSETFRTVVQNAWVGIQAAMTAAWAVIQPIFRAIGDFVTNTLAPIFVNLWTGVIRPVFAGIGQIISATWTGVIQPALAAVWAFISNVLAPSFLWLWRTIVQPAFAAIGQLISTAWTGVIQPIFQAVWNFISATLGPAFTWLWRTIILPAFAGIGQVITIAWTTVIKPLLTAIGDFIKLVLAPIFTWLWKTIIQPVWDGISESISIVWENGIQPVFNALKNAVALVAASFGLGADIIKTSWAKIQDYAKTPVNFVIGTVYNKGIRGLWNTIIGWLQLPEGLKLGEIPQLKKGGTLDNPMPVAPMVTNGPMAIVGEGRRQHPEFVIPTDPQYRERASKLWQAAGMKLSMFAPGGVLGFGDDIWGKIKDIAGDAVDLGGDALDLITNPKKVWDKLVGGLPKANFPGPFGTAVNAIPPKILDQAWTVAEKIIKTFNDGYGGKGAEGGLKWARKQAGKPYLWGGVGPDAYDCCIIGGVRIYGPSGAKPIQEIRPGDRVFTYVEGRLESHTVTAAWQSKRQPVFAVRTRNRKVTASANHPFLRVAAVDSRTVHTEEADWPGIIKISYGGCAGATCTVSTCDRPMHARGMCHMHNSRCTRHGDPRIVVTTGIRYETQWARLDELERGDLLVLPRSMPGTVQSEPTLPDGTPVDADVAWLIGASVGDGTVTDRSLRLCLYGDDRDRATRIIKERWPCKATHGESYGLVASNVQLARAMTALGMRRRGPDKRVPDAVWAWGPELQRAFLDGYCDADGHRPADQAKHGERTYASAAEELIEDVRAMHIMLGDAVSNISVTKRTKPITIKGKVVKNARPQYTLAIWPGGKTGVAALRTKPGMAEWLDAGDFTVAPVLGISDEGEQDTWDLEVDGAHNFVADGVVVHNSGFISALVNVIHGVKNPYSRLFSTASFDSKGGPGGFVRGLDSAMKVGVTHAGVGHMAGTLNGVNVESSGGAGVRVGGGARGWNDALFPYQYGLKFDDGGYLPPVNKTSSPEPVLTDQQWSALITLAQRGARTGPIFGDVYVQDEVDIDRLLDRAEFHQRGKSF